MLVETTHVTDGVLIWLFFYFVFPSEMVQHCLFHCG